MIQHTEDATPVCEKCHQSKDKQASCTPSWHNRYPFTVVFITCSNMNVYPTGAPDPCLILSEIGGCSLTFVSFNMSFWSFHVLCYESISQSSLFTCFCSNLISLDYSLIILIELFLFFILAKMTKRKQYKRWKIPKCSYALLRNNTI